MLRHGRFVLLSIALAVPSLLFAQTPKHSGKIVKIERLGELIREVNLPGERRSDDVVPGHTTALRLSQTRWLLLCNTRSFRGVDDERSVIYQLRKDAPDGPLLKEGFLARSINDWDPLGKGQRLVRQHGHVVGFGVPKGAHIGGKPAVSSNHFVVLWRVLAVPYDPEKKAVPRTPPELRRQTQAVECVQFRLNKEESDLEIVQPTARLRQVGFEKGEAFCSLKVRWMNQSFVSPVPANPACTEWMMCNHFDGGRIAVLKLSFDPAKGVYRWVQSGPLAGGSPTLMEASLAHVGQEWIIAARVMGKSQGIAWCRTRNPLEVLPTPKPSQEPATNAPLTVFVCGDGVPRLFTNAIKASTLPGRHGRDPLFMWQVHPGEEFTCTGRETIFDSVAARLPFRRATWPKVDFAALFPPQGKSQLVAYRVNVRSYNFPYDGRPGIPPILPEEKARCGVYYSRITYGEVAPGPWTFPGAP